MHPYFLNYGKSCTTCKEKKKQETLKRRKEKYDKRERFKKTYYRYESIIKSKSQNREAIFYTFEFTKEGKDYKEYGISVNWAARRSQYEKEGLVLRNIEAIFMTLLDAFLLEQSLFNEPLLSHLKPTKNLGFAGWTECFNITEATQKEKNILEIF